MAKKVEIKMQPVKSSNIAEIGYDEGTRTLQIKFNNGGLYQYSPVTADTWNEFKAAPSQGKWFHKNIRENDRIDQKRLN